MIENLENKKVKEFIKLKNNKKYRKEQKRFVIEGVRLVFDAIKMGVVVCDVFLTKECATKIMDTEKEFQDAVLSFKNVTQFIFCGEDALALSGLKYILISEKVAKKISSVKTNQGAFGVAKSFSLFNIKEIKENDLVLALVEVKDPGNLGALLRSAFSFGFLKVILVNCCEIYNEKVIRSSMGAVFGLSFLTVDNFLPALNFFKLKGIKTFATSLSKNSKNPEILNNEKGILILGNEAKGLPQAVIMNADNIVKIKMNKFFESMNVSCAGSILMYEMSKNNPNFV